MKYIQALFVLCFSLSTFAREKVVDFNIPGELTILKPEIINARPGEFKLGSAQTCGLFKCKDLRLTLKNETEKVEVGIPLNTSLTSIKSFDDYRTVKEEIPSTDSKLKVHAVNHLGEETVSYELKFYRASCESHCNGTSCTRRCRPDHTLCWKKTSAPSTLELVIAEASSGEVAAKFISKEKKYETSEKVLKVHCREHGED